MSGTVALRGIKSQMFLTVNSSIHEVETSSPINTTSPPASNWSSESC